MSNKKTLGLNDIPDELVCKISTYLGYHRINLATSSRRMNNLVKESRVNREIYNQDNNEFYLDFYDKCKNDQLKVLHIQVFQYKDSIYNSDLEIFDKTLNFSSKKSKKPLSVKLGDNFKILVFKTSMIHIIIDLYSNKTDIYYFSNGLYCIINFNSKVETIINSSYLGIFSILGFFSRKEICLINPSDVNNSTISTKSYGMVSYYKDYKTVLKKVKEEKFERITIY